MTDPFAPANGERARWRYCYDLVIGREPGEEVTLEEVLELLECEPDAAWAAMRTARRHLESDGQRTVRTVARFGWVVMRSAEHLREAENRTAKARVQVKGAIRVVDATRREELSQFERQELDRKAAQLAAQAQVMGTRRKSFAELEEASRRRELPRSG